MRVYGPVLIFLCAILVPDAIIASSAPVLENKSEKKAADFELEKFFIEYRGKWSGWIEDRNFRFKILSINDRKAKVAFSWGYKTGHMKERFAQFDPVLFRIRYYTAHYEYTYFLKLYDGGPVIEGVKKHRQERPNINKIVLRPEENRGHN